MQRLTGKLAIALMLAALAALGLGEAFHNNFINPGPRIPQYQLAYGLVTAVLVFWCGRPRRTPASAPRWGTAALIGGTTLLAALIAHFALEAYPPSADEYGFNYLADTLRQGRLWNGDYPENLRDVFETIYIGGHDGRRVSQYLPGWPAVLMLFKSVGLPEYANVVLGLAAACFLVAALRQLDTPPHIRLAVLLLTLAAPFTVFNDASYFSHTLTAAALLAIVWLEGRDADRPTPWNRVAIGFAFSVLLVTRAETFLICAALFGADALLRRRRHAVRWAVPAILGAIPLAALLLFYNWRITGSPFTTTQTYVNPTLQYGPYAMGMDGPHSPLRGVQHTVEWLGRWQDFASVVIIPLYGVALWCRMRTWTLRWFDLVWPGTVFFFFFFPDAGGFQYGPRYWYIGHAVMPLTVAAGLPRLGGLWSLGRFQLDPMRLAAAQLASFAGFTIGYAAFLYQQAESRLDVERIVATVPAPAVVLMESKGRRFFPWQGYSYQLLPRDFTRNGVGPLGPVAIGNYDHDDARVRLLCQQMPDRSIYILRLDRVGTGGQLVPQCLLPHSATAERK